MSFNWAEYLSVAETLCGVLVSGRPAGVEAQLRTGVSRAYYAAFVSARNRLRDVDNVLFPQNSNPHRFVADQYEKDADLLRRRIGIELRRLRRNRNTCDYDDVVNGLPKVTSRSLAQALQILTDLGSL